MRKIVITIFFSLWCIACGGRDGSEFVEPSVHYRADFDNSKIEVVENIMDDIADGYDLKVFREVVRSLQRDAHIEFKEVPSISH